MPNVPSAESQPVLSTSHGHDGPRVHYTDDTARQQGASLAATENTTLSILIVCSLNINHNIYMNAIYYNLFLFKHVHRSEMK